MAGKKKALTKVEKKILITGGTGCLGTHIVRQLIDAGVKNLLRTHGFTGLKSRVRQSAPQPEKTQRAPSRAASSRPSSSFEATKAAIAARAAELDYGDDQPLDGPEY